jgi:aldehyde dehydrogenase (NAD+)
MISEHSADLLKLQALQSKLRSGFLSGKTKPEHARLELLSCLEALVIENQREICAAITADLGRPMEDSIVAELSVVIEEVHTAKANLRKWVKPKNKWMPLVLFPSRGYVAPVPYGVCLIVGPWNYPIQLLLAPLISALAAGNCALLKPSELTPRCAQLLSELVSRYFPEDVVQVVSGGVETSQKLLELRWDLIFFTGSTAVGKVVARAAAQHLTPTVLELGGKSPCIVDASADLEVTARRILWGKTINAGQTCVAPDYILTHRENIEPLLAALKKVLAEFFPDGFTRSQSFCAIVNERHFTRLTALAEAQSKELVLGGKLHPESMVIEPSIYVLDIAKASAAPLMQEEIFGPLLPIVALDSREQAIDYINAHEHPLALYVFSADSEFIEQVEHQTQSGSFVANDTVIQLATSQLPFGGVGESGQGSYHGFSGFNAFSHQRSVLKRPFWLDLPVRYRPLKPWKMFILRKLLKFAEPQKLPSPLS